MSKLERRLQKKMRNSQTTLSGIAMSGTKKYKLNLPVDFEQEGEYYVAYCPALELSAYAKSKAGAKKAFTEVLTIFIKDTEEKGTLEKVLLGLGWKLQQKPKFKYEPPTPPEPKKGKESQRTRQVMSIPLCA
jgi:predicted RNase H-like HicB family nuclease